MSKESVNRWLLVLAALLWGALGLAPAGAQVGLVVGSVRDQHGNPVAAASVSPAGRPGALGATTDSAGTFALRADGVTAVTIACRYCRTATVPVHPGEPVVAIVLRYAALTQPAPSSDDLDNLPYAHVESAMALRPFALLEQSTHPLLGSQLGDRGLQPAGALLVDAGVPNYDVSFGSSPYDTIPAQYERTGDVESPSQAFTYGDRAGSGVVELNPFADASGGVALGGTDAIFRAQVGSQAGGAVVGTYSNGLESRQRGDVSLQVPLSLDQTLTFAGGTSQGRNYGRDDYWLNGDFSFARARFEGTERDVSFYGSFVADRGAYDAAYAGTTLGDVWSDEAFAAGARTRGAVQAFADVSSRFSTGIYDASQLEPRIAGTVLQNRADAGVEATGAAYDVTAGIGWFGVGYTGGTYGYSTPLFGHLATPSLDVALFPNGRWSADLSSSDSFVLPTLWQQYGYEGSYYGTPLVYDRAFTNTATLSYTDQARIVVSAEAAAQRVRGFSNGSVSSAGLSVAWQIAPLLSLRAWGMHVTDSTVTSQEVPVYPALPNAGTGALWMTYENAAALRVDAIYRRDVLNRQPFYHVDGALSGPLVQGIRWYAGVEDRLRSTAIDAGIRIGR